MMKKILLISTIALLASCATQKKVYVVVIPVPDEMPSLPKPEQPLNRFADQFREADAAFVGEWDSE